MSRVLVIAKDVLVSMSLRDTLIANGFAVDVVLRQDEIPKIIKERGHKLLIVDSSFIKDFRAHEFKEKVLEIILKTSNAVDLKVKWSVSEPFA